MRLEEVIVPKDPLKPENTEMPADKKIKYGNNAGAKVISIKDLKKK